LHFVRESKFFGHLSFKNYGEILMSFDLSYVVAGALTGFIVGITGVGGGALMTPILLLVFGVAPSVAVGTDLWFAAITKTAGVRVHQTRGMIDWKIACLLWIGSLPAAAVTLIFMTLWPDIFRNGEVLKHIIGAAILLTAVGIIFQQLIVGFFERQLSQSGHAITSFKPSLTILGGAILGVLVTLTSVGAGALGSVFLASLYPKRLDPRRLIATDIAHSIPLALVAGVGHLFAGHLDLILLGTLLIGSIPAIFAGSWLALRLPHRILRVAMAAVLSVVAWRLF
jgi:uncharacterized protein